VRHPVRALHRHPLALPPAETRLRFRDDLLEATAGVERGRGLAAPARAAAGRTAGGRHTRSLPGVSRLKPSAGDERWCGHRPVPGGPGQDRQQAPRDRRGSRHPAGHHADRRQPQRRDPADPTDPSGPADPRQTRPTCAARSTSTPTAATTTRATATRSDGSKSPRTSPGAAPNTAPDSAYTAGSWKAPSHYCTGSAAYASAGRSATTSTRPSSHSVVPSSAGDD
jgi:hypothetical protein